MCAFILSLIIVLSFVSCKSPESADDISANIYVSNEHGLELDIYMNGIFQFSLEFLFYEIIEDVSGGTYEIVAKRKDSGDVLATNTVIVNASDDYWVSVVSGASLKIVNEYGETLNIYTNGSLQGELGNGESQVFSNLPYGDHVLEASKTSDNALVSSKQLSVTEDKEYIWTIK